MRKTLSVVIPCLNDADLLQRCLSSLAAQTVAPDEIIVVDNGSTDHSVEVAQAAGARVVTEPRRGITWANAAGCTAATSELIMRIDADSTLPPTHIEQLLKTWEQADLSSPRHVVAITGDALFDLAGWRGRLVSKLYLGAYRFSVGLALGHYPLFGSNCSFRRDWWDSVAPELDLADTYVHDDIQLSFAVRPSETVWFQKDLVITMDPRALYGARQLRTRFSRGMHSISAAWRLQPPYRRLALRR